MKRIKDIWYKQVHWLDENYTVGGIVLTFAGTILFLLLCGLAEGAGR